MTQGSSFIRVVSNPYLFGESERTIGEKMSVDLV